MGTKMGTSKSIHKITSRRFSEKTTINVINQSQSQSLGSNQDQQRECRTLYCGVNPKRITLIVLPMRIPH